MTTFRHTDVDVQVRDRVYDGYFQVDRYRLRHRTYAGGWTEPLMREVFERGAAAAVLPYDPIRDEVVLIEQFRPGAFAAGDPHPWLVEIVAGIIGGGETPEGVAHREAMEEAAVPFTALEPIGGMYLSAGAMSEYVHLFIGRCDAAAAGGIHGLVHEGEDIRVMVLPAEQALAELWAGGIRTAPAYAALAWLAARRSELRRRWRG